MYYKMYCSHRCFIMSSTLFLNTADDKNLKKSWTNENGKTKATGLMYPSFITTHLVETHGHLFTHPVRCRCFGRLLFRQGSWRSSGAGWSRNDRCQEEVGVPRWNLLRFLGLGFWRLGLVIPSSGWVFGPDNQTPPSKSWVKSWEEVSQKKGFTRDERLSYT